jgi:hypothetical protein
MSRAIPLEPHDAILGHHGHVIGKDVRIGPQRLHHLRGEDFIRQSGPGDDDLSARRLITRLRDGRLRQGYHPAGSQPHP